MFQQLHTEEIKVGPSVALATFLHIFTLAVTSLSFIF